MAMTADRIRVLHRNYYIVPFPLFLLPHSVLTGVVSFPDHSHECHSRSHPIPTIYLYDDIVLHMNQIGNCNFYVIHAINTVVILSLFIGQ